MRRAAIAAMITGWLLACGAGGASQPDPRPPGGGATEGPDTVVLSIVGTNDVHGHLYRLAVLGGFVERLRRIREEDGGAVLLIDAGDMFQGTVESNMLEGAPVVAAYEALGYDAAAVGNHELDFGPVGEAATPASADDDPRGALLARAAEADFPILTANILDAGTGERVDWPGIGATTTVTAAGVDVGIVGVSTAETLQTTLAANVADLAMAPVAETIEREARRLRREGADVVVVTAHAGGSCEAFDDPRDLSACATDDEIFEVARALPEGLVDAVVAGHSHEGVAHVVHGIPIIESYALAVAFGRIDLVVDRDAGRVVDTRVHPPHPICGSLEAPEPCEPGTYEGAAVVPDREVAAAIAEPLARAEEIRREPLGVTIDGTFERDGDAESPLGNLLADLILEARPAADVALMNGGGIRAPLAEGELTYGELFETWPFDNRFAMVRTTAGALARSFAENLGASRGIFSVSGARVVARCEGDRLEVTLHDGDGEPLAPDAPITVATSDFLATGGDGAFGDAAEVRIEQGRPMREVIVELLRERGGTLSPNDPDVFDPEAPRLEVPGERPVTCD